MSASPSPLHIGRTDLLIVNGIGPNLRPRISFNGAHFYGAFAASLFNGTNHFLDAARLAEMHALLLRIEGRLR